MLLEASLVALKNHEDEINKLNVFPVPDGDTGTNMAHTIQSVLNEVLKTDNASPKELSKAIIYGSLLGARGNSGVILSQIIKGFCEEIEKYDDFSASAIAKALGNASRVAYEAVKKPAEGTMLTVVNDMAAAAEKLSSNGMAPLDFISGVVDEGIKSVERTPFLLPVLKEAGVVDAGGYGLVVIAQGILSALKGESVNGQIAKKLDSASPAEKDILEEDFEFTYCTEFVLKSNGIDIKKLESKIDPLGDSTLVVGTPELTKVHIHTNDPGLVIQIATSMGSITDVQINNIVEQSRARSEAIKAGDGQHNIVNSPATGIGVVAVANGSGVKDILLNLGVDRIVNGGQSMNPSAADILNAVNDIPSADIVLLPNNKNIILTAEQVSGLTNKNIAVIPTRSIPEAFAALLSFDKQASLTDNKNAMTAAFSKIKTGEVTCAIRDANNGDFKKHDFIGLFNGEIRSSGNDLLTTTCNLIEKMLAEDDEVITILAGDQVADNDTDILSMMIKERFPELELDIHRGDQPVYHFVIGIE